MPCGKREFYQYKVSEEASGVASPETKPNHIWTGFKEQTTAHGLPHVHQARGIFKTVFWTIISLACTGLLILNLYYISDFFFSYKVDVVVALKHERELIFPAVTICNMNPVKESGLNYSNELASVVLGANGTSWLAEDQAYEILAGLDYSTKRLMGYQQSEFIIDCQYAGSNCRMDDFATFFDPNYGNCYIFNSGWDSASYTVENSKRAGRRHGMKFILNVKQDEYLQTLAQGAGARILIHSQAKMPFPSDEGILATPGQITSIGIRQVYISRLDGSYGNCTDPGARNTTRNVYEELYTVNYTSTACYKTCYQKYVIDSCNCADPQYPRKGDAFDRTTDAPVCQVQDSTQDLCKKQISTDYQNNDLECNCPTQCKETAYSFEVSNVEWPSEVHEPVVLQEYAAKIPDVVSANDTSTKLRRNVLKVEVYFQEFNYETMEERPAYLPANYVSDIGGILGLWLGLSVLSIFEFFELGADLCVLCCYKCCKRETKTKDLRKKKGLPNTPPPPYTSNEALQGRNAVSTGHQTMQPDGSLKYV